jgi:hypothetical protein
MVSPLDTGLLGQLTKQVLRHMTSNLLSQVIRVRDSGLALADLVGVLELVPVTGHDQLQDQHWLAGGIAGGHVHREQSC